VKGLINKIAPVSIAALAVIGLTAPGASAQVAPANEASETELPEHIQKHLDDTDDDAYVFYAPEVEETSTEQSWTQIAPDVPDKGGQEIEPQQILNPIDVNNCIAGITPSGLTLQNYASMHNGMVALQCGTLASGLRHIADGHSTNWINKMGGAQGTWYDYMSFSVNAALTAPSLSLDRPENNSRCYTTPIQVYDESQNYIETFYPRAAVSNNNQIVITAFPQNTENCS
jgi:hypothetical protein